MKSKMFLKQAAAFCVSLFILVLSSMIVSAQNKTVQPQNSTLLPQRYISPQTINKGTILSEDFEGGDIPEDWGVIYTNSYQNWFIGTDPAWAHNGSCEAWVNYDNHENSDEWLITPNLNLIDYETVTFVLWVWSDTNFPGATTKIHIRSTGVDDIIWDLIEDENWTSSGWYPLLFDLSSYSGTTINISWQYVGFNGQSFGVDDIEIFGTLLLEPTLQITSITGPIGVTAVIKNIGDANATNLQWTMTLDGGLILLGKSKTGTEPTLSINESLQIKIPFILGFGSTTITVTASCTEGATVEKTQNATIFLILVFLK